jgi:hypothetical protein
MSHVHVKINFAYRLDSWNRCLSVHKRLQIWALAGRYDNPIPTQFLAPVECLKIPAHCVGNLVPLWGLGTK